MPRYDFKCPKCGFTKEMVISYEETKEPSEETIYQTSCPKNEVCKEENPELEDVRFDRLFSAPNLMGFYNGSSNLTPDEKRSKTQAERKLRSKNHFANEVLPTLPKVERLQYKRKWHKEGFKPEVKNNSK